MWRVEASVKGFQGLLRANGLCVPVHIAVQLGTSRGTVSCKQVPHERTAPGPAVTFRPFLRPVNKVVSSAVPVLVLFFGRVPEHVHSL